ncbi:unnamed protein product [Boreogadus saida]
MQRSLSRKVDAPGVKRLCVLARRSGARVWGAVWCRGGAQSVAKGVAQWPRVWNQCGQGCQSDAECQGVAQEVAREVAQVWPGWWARGGARASQSVAQWCGQRAMVWGGGQAGAGRVGRASVRGLSDDAARPRGRRRVDDQSVENGGIREEARSRAGGACHMTVLCGRNRAWTLAVPTAVSWGGLTPCWQFDAPERSALAEGEVEVGPGGQVWP